MQTWNVRREPKTDYSEELDRHIKYYFFQIGLEDDEMLEMLQVNGFKVTKWGLV